MLAGRARACVDAGDPLRAVRLTDIVLAVEPDNVDALQVKLAAHELLLERSGETFSEIMWLQAEIRQTKQLLGIDYD